LPDPPFNENELEMKGKKQDGDYIIEHYP